MARRSKKIIVRMREPVRFGHNGRIIGKEKQGNDKAKIW